MQKNVPPDEWFVQALYDLDTAETLFHAERYVHAVFMVHLSVGKALKGVYMFRVRSLPPKTHDLVHLIEVTGLYLPDNHSKLIASLRDAHLITRYPVELDPVIATYNRTTVRTILDQTEQFINWTKKQL